MHLKGKYLLNSQEQEVAHHYYLYQMKVGSDAQL